MRWKIVYTLVHKEYLRHLANKGGIVLALLLVGFALLISLSKTGSQGPILGGQAQRCYLIHWCNETPYPPDVKEFIISWVEFLRVRAQPKWTDHEFRVRPSNEMRKDQDGNLLFDPNSASIQIDHVFNAGTGRYTYEVSLWHPGEDSSVMAGYEAWFWKETRAFLNTRRLEKDPEIIEQRQRQIGSADLHSSLATMPVIFALFFTCVYLLPSFTCEERERGVLLAQALSPASPFEILVAKFLFYPLIGMGLSALLAGIYRPTVLVMPYFWLALLASALGSLGVGMTIATLAGTQRLASVGAMCYLLVVASLILTLQQINFALPCYLLLEFYGPRMFHSALANAVRLENWGQAAGTLILALAWLGLATYLFRKRGWQ